MTVFDVSIANKDQESKGGGPTSGPFLYPLSAVLSIHFWTSLEGTTNNIQPTIMKCRHMVEDNASI